MINEKLSQLIDLLTKKTINREAIWNKGSGDKQFKLILKNGIAVTVSYSVSPFDNPDYYTVSVYNENGDIIQRYITSEETSPYELELISNFHQAANDAYYKVDETFDSLLQSVSSGGTIGTVIKEVDQSGNITADDDLPF